MMNINNVRGDLTAVTVITNALVVEQYLQISMRW